MMIPQLDQTDVLQSCYVHFFDALKQSSFGGEIHTDYANRVVLSTDNSVYQMLPQGVVYPRSTSDVIVLCELLNEAQFREIVIAPRGGGTGTNAQSLTDGVVIDLSRYFDSILEINADKRWVRVQSGVVKDQLNAALKPYGLFFAPELSTSNRATIGGMINTDASGQGSCVYGKTRDHVIEIETVLLDGEVLRSKALSDDELRENQNKNSRIGRIHQKAADIFDNNKTDIDKIFPSLNRCLTGYDLAHIRDDQDCININNILCGSEGTLGIITEAKLNLLPIPKFSALIIVKYADFEASLRDATELMKAGPTSIETIDSKVLNLAMSDFIWQQVKPFFDEKTTRPIAGINLVEFTSDNQESLRNKLDALIETLRTTGAEKCIGYTEVIGQESVDKVWAMRKRAVGLLGNANGEARPVAFVEDTAVPPEHLADFIMAFRAILDSHKLDYGMFGHVDAGVLHVRPALDMKDETSETLAWKISDEIAALTQKYNGLLWGEHGKGVRSQYAPAFFGPLYPLLQDIKATFDPFNQLNPGKIATPNRDTALLKVNEVTTRGGFDRAITKSNWSQFSEAVYCNGNGACHNWNYNDAMCPSWKGTRLRTHTPKGRASLIKEWLRLLSIKRVDTQTLLARTKPLTHVLQLPKKIQATLMKRRGEYDFSHEVYDSMAACLACKSCTGQCPIKVDVPEFRSKFLALYHTRYLRPVKDYMVASLEFILPIFSSYPSLYNICVKAKPVELLLKRYVGFVDGPAMSTKCLVDANIETANVTVLRGLSKAQKARTVIIVQDAFTRYFETSLLIDVFAFLERLGFKPLLAPYKANGKPLHVHGFLDAFTRTAKRNVDMLKHFSNEGIALVGLDPSMTLTYRSEYKKYIPDDDLVPVHLLQEWLLSQKAFISEQFSAKPVAQQQFHLLPHCTEKTNANESVKQWQNVFSLFGYTLHSIDVGCCGMAGTFGHESRNLETSRKIYNQSWRAAVDEQPPTGELLATGYSCRCQVKREQSIHIKHPLQALLQCLSQT